MAYVHHMKSQPTPTRRRVAAVVLAALLGVGAWRVVRLETQVAALKGKCDAR